MTRIGHQNLYATRLTGTITYDRTLEFLVMYNNNPVPLYVRLGSPEIPNESNYDISVPPNYIMAISVNSNQFGFRLGETDVVISQVTGNTVVEATIDEPPPSLGGVPINNASLSTADLLNGIPTFNGVTVYGPFNINQWGGVIVNVMPAIVSGQGVIQVDVSPDGVTWTGYQTWAFWPNIPATILIPRVSQFVKITLNATAIIGEPAITGKVSIRGSLTEITTSSYTPQGTSITRTYVLAASGAQQYQFVTPGLPAISIAAIATAGTGASASITLLVEASSDLVNWRQVTFRTQRMSIGITLYRALGNLDLFMRVTVFEVSGVAAANGTVYLSIPKEPDLGAILNTIQQSLGDTSAPTNTNQDIYHELDSIRTNTNTQLGTIIASLTSINTSISTTNTNLGTIITSIGTTNTTLGTINTNISSMVQALSRTSYVVTGQLSYTNPGTFQVVGFLMIQGSWIEAATFGYSCVPGAINGGGFAGMLVTAAYGTGGGAVASFYTNYGTVTDYTNPVSGVRIIQGYCPTMKYDSIRSPGVVIPTNDQVLWLACAPVTPAFNILIAYTLSLVV